MFCFSKSLRERVKKPKFYIITFYRKVMDLIGRNSLTGLGIFGFAEKNLGCNYGIVLSLVSQPKCLLGSLRKTAIFSWFTKECTKLR